MTSPERDPESVRVGATIRALREAHGLKVVELARAVDISDTHMTNIEAGRKTASTAICRRIADTFRVPLAAITIADYERIAESA